MATPRISALDVRAMLRTPGTRLLGEGGNGRVFRSWFRGRECALKVGLYSEQADDFEEEVALMEALRGAGGSPVLLGFCPETPAILMTLCGSCDLYSYLFERNLEHDRRHLLDVALRVTERVQEIHRAGFVHNDLKAENIMVSLDVAGRLEDVHVIDFGYSCIVGEAQRPSEGERHFI